MSSRALPPLAFVATLGGCALVYQYGDYRDQGAGGGSSSTSAIGGGGATTSTSTSSDTGSSVTTTTSTTTSSTSTSTSSTTSATTGSGLGNGSSCTDKSQCASGHCTQGQGIGQVCCALECSVCTACTTDGGSCANVGPGKQTIGCSATGSRCDGMGQCTNDGAACSQAGDCTSKNCERASDGSTQQRCCASPCGQCAGCSISGYCSLLAAGTADSYCTATRNGTSCGGNCACDAVGDCKLPQNASCAYGSDCGPGLFCRDRGDGMKVCM